jgi:hypothetical protein
MCSSPRTSVAIISPVSFNIETASLPVLSSILRVVAV